MSAEQTGVGPEDLLPNEGDGHTKSITSLKMMAISGARTSFWKHFTDQERAAAACAFDAQPILSRLQGQLGARHGFKLNMSGGDREAGHLDTRSGSRAGGGTSSQRPESWQGARICDPVPVVLRARHDAIALGQLAGG